MKFYTNRVGYWLLFLAISTQMSDGKEVAQNLQKENLVAWCIVPFDAKKRGPAERAKMLSDLGIRRCAYDWRKENIPQFEQEIIEYKKHGIEFFAFWGGHQKAFELFEKYDLHPQIWHTLGSPTEGTQQQKVEAAATALEALARKTAGFGGKLGLYNHGGWGGEPKNLVAVCKRLREKGYGHVGIVYNWHHAHEHIEDWAESLALMKPYLWCLNLNGMNNKAQPKIVPLAQGQHELEMLKTLVESGYQGPVGILDHQNQLDAKESLQDNLKGLLWLKKELVKPGSGGAKPVPQAKPLVSKVVNLSSAKNLTIDRAPLEPENNPYWQENINRDRAYDFYAKQALLYGKMTADEIPDTLPAFPGLDGGQYGHWGNQNDADTWKDGRVREMDHGSMVSGVFRGGGKTIRRAVSVSIGKGYNAVFDQDSLRFELAWRGDLVKWSDVRRGFMHGIPMGKGQLVSLAQGEPPAKGATYLGLYRRAGKVIFCYLENGRKIYRCASVNDGKVEVKNLELPDLSTQQQWAERVKTQGRLGQGQPYAIDTLTLPYDNPWKALFFVSGVDFISKNRLTLCTMHGDVWIADVSGDDLKEITWKRYAAGLHQPLGLKVVDGVIHVRCRDQIVALHDLNADDEADFYECVSSAQETGAGGHEFITGLQRDLQGRWYFASGNQGLCRVSVDGKKLEVLATGFRNPNGLGINADGSVILTSVQEGNWTPASAVCDVIKGEHYGAGGPKSGNPGYRLPMLYLPRGLDNSSGGQTHIDSDRWGPVKGNWLHFSSGFCKFFLLLREVIDGQSQAAAIPLPGSFVSGSHRGRFSPYDGQLYVASAQGWGNYGVKDGGLERVRFVGGAYPYPIKFETRDNGILLSFSEVQKKEILDASKWFAQQWNYGYSAAYGSPEYSVKDVNLAGHNRLKIRSVHGLEGRKQVFIEIPQLQAVNQLHLHYAGTPRVEVFATLHRLGKAFTDFPRYQKIKKQTLAVLPQISESTDPEQLIKACLVCHHPTIRVVGPPFSEIRKRYANNPEGIVKWAMQPENKNPNLPPMPSFEFLGKEKLKIIAEKILSGGD